MICTLTGFICLSQFITPSVERQIPIGGFRKHCEIMFRSQLVANRNLRGLSSGTKIGDLD